MEHLIVIQHGTITPTVLLVTKYIILVIMGVQMIVQFRLILLGLAKCMV